MVRYHSSKRTVLKRGAPVRCSRRGRSGGPRCARCIAGSCRKRDSAARWRASGRFPRCRHRRADHVECDVPQHLPPWGRRIGLRGASGAGCKPRLPSPSTIRQPHELGLVFHRDARSQALVAHVQTHDGGGPARVHFKTPQPMMTVRRIEYSAEGPLPVNLAGRLVFSTFVAPSRWAPSHRRWASGRGRGRSVRALQGCEHNGVGKVVTRCVVEGATTGDEA